MKKKHKQVEAEKQSNCPLPLSPAERKEKMTVWLAGMPQDVRAKAEKLTVVEFIVGMGPACVGIYRQPCDPPIPFEEALYRLAGRADLFRRGTLIFSDGSRLDFEPLKFCSYYPGPGTKKKG
jgi:hypothetical protein